MSHIAHQYRSGLDCLWVYGLKQPLFESKLVQVRLPLMLPLMIFISSKVKFISLSDRNCFRGDLL